MAALLAAVPAVVLAAPARPVPAATGSFTATGAFGGLAASSARHAWAVGGTDGGKTLIVAWNGSTWRRVRGHGAVEAGFLSGAVATSARSAWAVGTTTGGKTLILAWNGTAWKRVRSPGPSTGGNALAAVAATSARNAWAVGYAGADGALTFTLIARWNGINWR